MTTEEKTPAIDPKEHWHLKREIQLSHVFSTLAIAIGAFWYAADIDKRITLVEQAAVTQRERDIAQDTAAIAVQASVNAQLARMDAQLTRIDANVYRLVEQRGNRP